MVRAEMCSEVDGSKRITLPCVLPGYARQHSKRVVQRMMRSLPNATFPLRMKVATLICSYAAKRATSSPVRRSQTMAVLPMS